MVVVRPQSAGRGPRARIPGDHRSRATAAISAVVNRRFRVRAFGSFAVCSDAEGVDVSPGLASAIVARLALSAGQTVTTERLISSLWDSPPANAAGSLRVY